jgi:hypothetical protein
MAQALASNNPSSWPHQNNRGAALYRAGQLDAVEWLQKAAKIAPEGGSPYDWLFLAMAEHRLGHKAQARQYLDKSIAWMNDRLQPGTGREPRWASPPLWRVRLELQILRREAEALIGK